METKPLPVGGLAPPFALPPHALIVPEASSAAKEILDDAMVTKPLPVGASMPGPSAVSVLPPDQLGPHTLIVPEASSAAKAYSLAHCPLQ